MGSPIKGQTLICDYCRGSVVVFRYAGQVECGMVMKFRHIFQSKNDKVPKRISGLDGVYSFKRLTE